MKSGIFLVCTLLIIYNNSCYGMVCYMCESKKLLEGGVDKDLVFETGEAATVKPEGTLPPLDNMTGLTLPTPNASLTTLKPLKIESIVINEAEQARLPKCKGDYKKNKWLHEECPSKYRACYKIKGKMYAREDNIGGTYEVTKRGCWAQDSEDGIVQPFIMAQGKLGECRSVNTDRNKNSLKADLCVCDEMDSDDMSCNQGMMMSTTNIIVNIFLILLLVNL